MQTLAFYCNLIALTLVSDSAKELRVTKLSRKVSFNAPGGVESKKVFPEIIIHKILETNSRFDAKYCTTRKV